MSRWAFYFTAPWNNADFERAVAGHLGVPDSEVRAFTDWDDAPDIFCPILVQPVDEPLSNVRGWFELKSVNCNEIADIPLARALARALGQRIICRDPVPDPRDNDIISAAQTAVDPDGREEAMWLTEYSTDDRRSVIEVIARSELDP